VRCDDFDALGDLQARRIGIDDEGADAADTRCFAGAGEDHVEIRDAAVGDPGLFAIEDIAVAVRVRGAAHGRDIRAGLRLGQGEGRHGGPAMTRGR
jgi:hypothetical protein